jgi:hypothetical protein
MCITVNPTTVQNKTVLIYLNCEDDRAIFGYKAPEFTNKGGHQINYLVFLLPTTSKITPIDVKDTNLLQIINNISPAVTTREGIIDKSIPKQTFKNNQYDVEIYDYKEIDSLKLAMLSDKHKQLLTRVVNNACTDEFSIVVAKWDGTKAEESMLLFSFEPNDFAKGKLYFPMVDSHDNDAIEEFRDTDHMWLHNGGVRNNGLGDESNWGQNTLNRELFPNIIVGNYEFDEYDIDPIIGDNPNGDFLCTKGDVNPTVLF